MTKVPSAAEAGQVEVSEQRPEHSREYPGGKPIGVGERYGDGKGEPSLRPQGPDPLPDRSV